MTAASTARPTTLGATLGAPDSGRRETGGYGKLVRWPKKSDVSTFRLALNFSLAARSSAWRRGALVLVAVAVAAGIAAPSAFAAPNITLDKQAPAEVLVGEDSPVTLLAANPAGQPYGYNLSFRDVLPAGVSYVPGSASVAPLVIPNAPAAGQTTLIFENVSDLSPGSSYSLSYEVRHNTGVLGVGGSYTNNAGAYINTDPRFVPDFAANGTPTGDFTGSATDSATTDINAIEIEKDEPSPEGELLRGVHDHQTVYTLTVRNNAVQQTTGLDVEDWLPAGLEYLGCGTDDNTTDAPTNPAASPNEYAGSGPLNPGNAPAAPNCVVPDLVETVSTDPDGAGPMPTAVYTHVVWNDIGAVPASGQIQIQYVAGIPIRQNTTTWVGGVQPTPASLDQGSNLDNNSGAETQDEQALTNYATAAGDYNGTLPVSDDDTLTRTAEDLAVLKSVDQDTINQGQISEWSLLIRTSEYRYVDNVRVEDTLPDGLCPLGSTNLEGGGQQIAECNPTGDEPSDQYTSVTESADGSWTLAWNQTNVPELARMQPSSEFTITFPTRTRAFYQENFNNDQPVRARDSWENTVDIVGTDFRICAPSDPDCTGAGTKINGDEVDGVDDIDTSSAGQEAGGITIDKKVRTALPTPVSCSTGSYIDGPPPNYGPGDTVCWQLRIDFAGQLDSGDPILTDFLPGVSYVAGSAVPTGNNTVTSTFSDADAPNGRLTWDLGDDVDAGGLVFEWRFATVVQQNAGDSLGDIEGNLMKLAYENSEGESFPLRDEVNFERSQALLDLVKGVRDIDNVPAAGNPPNTDGGTVGTGDVVTFRVDVSNDGDLDAADAVIWDELQDGITCAQVTNISNGGTCPGAGAGTRITWTGLAVAAGADATLTYDVTIPAGVEPSRRFDNNAGVVSYTSETNTGGDFTYVPANNINPSAPTANATAADDPSFVTTGAVTMTKTRTTAVNELPGNNAASQATIGERIDYTVTFVIPEGTTIYSPAQLSDVLGARHAEILSVTSTLNGGPLPGTFTTTVNPVTLAVLVELSVGSYSNPAGSGDDTFVVAIATRVADVAANRRTSPNQTLTNTGNLGWNDADGTDRSLSANVSTEIVEPNVQVAKNEDDPDDRVAPGDTVNYTLSVTNPTTPGRVSTAHDLQLVDHVPAGLTPVLASISNGGVWNAGARTITWTIASIAPGAAAVTRTYAVTVDDPASAGSTFPNTVDLTATSMAGSVTGERGPGSPITAGYVAQAQRTIQLGDATLTKSVDPGTATVGEQVTYTTEVVFPGSVTYFDATVIDMLPDGMDFDETVGVTCDGGPCTPAVEQLPSQPQSDGSTRLAWFIGDLPNQPASRTIRITYTAHVDDQYVPPAPVQDGQTLTNVADTFYNGTNVIVTPPTEIPDPGSFSSGSNFDTADVDVIEPDVVLDKDVSDDADEEDVRPTEPGDSYTYSVTVTNRGTAPAYDVEVTDTPDETKLTNISVIPSPDADETDTDGSDGTLGWTIPGPIAPGGGSVTLTYTANLVPSAQLSDGDTVVNTADVPRFWGVPLAERQANGFDYREYTSVDPDTVTLTVHLPQLGVTKTTGGTGFPDSAVAQVGEPFPWRVVISNTSTVATAESVDVSDVLPANWEYVADSASFAPGGAVNPTIAGQTLTWENVGDLAPGGNIVLTFQARPTQAAVTDPGTGTGSPNVNTVDASAVDVSGATGSADGPYTDEDTAQAILEVPELTLVKTPDGATVDAGDSATYTITIANAADVPAREVVVTDVLGAAQAYTAGTATASPTTGFSETSVTAGPGAGETTIEWEIVEIPANGSVTITLPFATDPSLAAATNLVNDASVVSREITTPVSDDGSYESTVDGDVSIVKEAQDDPVNAGEQMDFTFTVTNNGPSDATGVTVTDVLPANLTFVSAEDPCTGTTTITCAIGDLDEGDSVTLTLRVLIDADETLEVVNTATVTSTTPDTNDTNNESTATKPVGVLANVAVVKDAPTDPVLQGTSFDYVINVSNTGASSAVNVTLNDPLPAGVAFESVTTDVGTCSAASGPIECSFGTMQPGDDAQVTVRVLAVDVGTWTNVATVSTPSLESTTDDNEDPADVTVVPASDLGVTKSAPATVDAGAEIPYALEVINNGPSPATGVTLSDTLPAGVVFVSADPACTHAAGLVTCAVGDLAVSETRSYAVTVEAPFALGDQELTNSVIVDGNEGDLVPENDSDQATTTIGPSADLSITKTAGGAIAGGSASWTLVIHNEGPSTADPVTVTDTLPAGTTVQSATPSQGSCRDAVADVVCDLGAMGAGGSAQIQLITTVPDGTAHQQLRNRAKVSAPQPDPDPSDNESEATTEVSERTASGWNLTLTKTATTERPQLGKPLSYQLVARNIGDSPAADVRLLDTLSANVRFKRVATTAGKCSHRRGQVRCELGTLAPGAQATVTVTVIPIAGGELRNTASVSAGNGVDMVPADNTDRADVDIAAPKARWSLAKRASRRAVRGGNTVRFTLTVRVRGRAVTGARVCDPLPDGLVFVRARGATFRKGRACWTIDYIAPGSSRKLRIVARAERGFSVRNVRNVAVATARNAPRRTDAAPVRIDPAFGGASGGVTG